MPDYGEILAFLAANPPQFEAERELHASLLELLAKCLRSEQVVTAKTATRLAASADPLGNRQLTARAVLTLIKGEPPTDLSQGLRGLGRTRMPWAFARKGAGVLFERLDGSAWALDRPAFLHRFEGVDLHHEGKRGGKALRR